jgi:outer membrane protein OmpA-like peptidoglycan-associated protein
MCAAVGGVCLILLDAVFAPRALEASSTPRDASPPASPTGPAGGPSPSANAPATTAPARTYLPAPARVPTIVARFESEQKEPADESGIRALATAMIEDHAVRVVLEGHSDTRGGEDYNQQISLARANWVKERLVALGVSPDRVETVGLGATRPLRFDDMDAQAINRRVEVRWIGR